MDEASEVVETAILITQYEQKAKAEIVKLQFHLGQAQTESQALKDAAAKDTNEINALRMEGSHLKEKCSEAQHRYEMLTVLLPSISSSAQKARDDADTLIREIEIRKTTYAQEVMELKGMIERKLKLRDVICDRIKRRVQHIITERDGLIAEREELATRCRQMQQRQQAIVQCEQRIAQLEESSQQLKQKLEHAKQLQTQRLQPNQRVADMRNLTTSASSSSSSSSSTAIWGHPEASALMAATSSVSSSAPVVVEAIRARLMKRELGLIRTELDDIKMLLQIHAAIKASLNSSSVERVADLGPEAVASTHTMCVECTYQTLAQAQPSVSTEEASSQSHHEQVGIHELDFSSEKVNHCGADDDSGLFSPRSSSLDARSALSTPACSPHTFHSASMPDYSLQLSSLGENSHVDPPSESVQTPHPDQSDAACGLKHPDLNPSCSDLGHKRGATEMMTEASTAAGSGFNSSLDPSKRVRVEAAEQ